MKFRMKITYPDGSIHEGKKDFTHWTDHLGITDYNFAGLSVHDIATDEGWWAFWAEQNGAAYIEASDVEDFADYDWGWYRDQDFINQHNTARGGRQVFDFHHQNLASKVIVKRQSVYDLKGEFDVIFCHGLLYHLRHPLLALDVVRKACKGWFLMETFVDDRRDPYCADSKFYRTSELGPVSNWTGASTACVASWLKDAGFDHVLFCAQHFPRDNRQTFVAIVDDSYLDFWRGQQNLAYCDKDYWQNVFDRTKFSNRLTYNGD